MVISTQNFVMKKARFGEVMGRIKAQKVLVVGDVGIDRYTMGSASRLSPEAPVPVVMVTGQSDKLGMAANVADNIQAFGGVPLLAALVGEDRTGDEFFSLLAEKKIGAEAIVRHSTRRTSLKERVIAQSQHVVRIDHEVVTPLSSEAEKLFLDRTLPLVKSCDGIIFEDYAKGVLTESVVQAFVQEAKKHGKLVTVDPTTQTRSPKIFRGVSVFKPNANEAERITGIEIRDEASLEKVAEKLLAETEAGTVIITRGKDGMTLFPRSGKRAHIPTFARAVYDVSGAGDTVIAMLTLALGAGATLEESALLANYAAGVEVGKQGTATVTVAELEEYMLQLNALV